MLQKGKTVKRILALFMVALMFLAYVPEAAAAGKVKSVTVTNLPSTTLTLKKGASKTLKVKVVAASGTVSQKVTYQSSKTSVATVSSAGKITAKKKGTANITITSKANTKKKVVIKVTVGTPSTKVSLNKTSATILPNKTVTLKATVGPTSASNKNVVWTTSNKNVATVTSKGVVKGIKAGTAKITATAADGSGKKATATITVKNPIVVSSVKVLNEGSIRVTLSAAQELGKSAFTVKLNQTGLGSYNKTVDIWELATTNNKTYDIILNDVISEGDRVQVTVKGLWGTSSSVKTATYVDGPFTYEQDEVRTVVAGDPIDASIEFDGKGYHTVSVTGLPEGLEERNRGNEYAVLGKLTEVGKTTTVITAKDELGHTYITNMIFLVADQENLVAHVSESNARCDDGYVHAVQSICVSGGSGSYIYSIEGETENFSVDDGWVYFYKEDATSGTSYSATIKITDANNENLTTTAVYTIHTPETITVSGIVKDMDGNAIPYANVVFSNRNKGLSYDRYFYANADENGKYTLELTPGVYDLSAGIDNAYQYTYSYTISEAKDNLNIQVYAKKVQIKSNNAAASSDNFGDWCDTNEENWYGGGNAIYLKPGTYDITTSYTLGVDTYVARVTGTVTSSTESLTAKVTIHEPETITVGAKEMEATGTYVFRYYKFVPETSGRYYFYSESNSDPHIKLLDENQEWLAEQDDVGVDRNFSISNECEAGKTYYVGIAFHDGGSATIHISTTAPAAE